jgi:hypothetical protein
MELNPVDCPKCGASISDQITKGQLFKCRNCGNTLVWPENQAKLVLSFGVRLCPTCGIDNELGRKYCRNCGNALIKTCPICNSVFYAGDKFCPNGHDYKIERLGEEIRLLIDQYPKTKQRLLDITVQFPFWDKESPFILALCDVVKARGVDVHKAIFQSIGDACLFWFAESDIQLEESEYDYILSKIPERDNRYKIDNKVLINSLIELRNLEILIGEKREELEKHKAIVGGI